MSPAMFQGAEPWLQVELHSGSTCTLVLRGALCGTSIAALEVQVDQLGWLPCDDVVVDVQQLQDLDLVGANVLFGLYHYVDGRGGKLRIVGAKGHIAAMLRRCAAGLDTQGTIDGAADILDLPGGDEAVT